MKKYLWAFFSIGVIFTLLQSCQFHMGSIGTWHNKVIDQDVRDEMNVINKKLFKDIMTNNIVGVKKVMSEALLNKAGKSADTVVSYIANKFKATSYNVLDEFYLKNLDDVTTTHLKSNRENSNDYQLEFVAINKETYVSVLVSAGLPINCMVLAIYGKYGNTWKLNMLEMGEYAVMDQTAPDYYSVASTQIAKGNYIDGVDMIVLASQLAHPAGKYFQYLNDYEMSDTYSIIIKQTEAQYHFPLKVAEIKTHPEIFSVGPFVSLSGQFKGVLPMIKYKSLIPRTDTVALKAENNELQKIIGNVFQNIDKNKTGIYYQAYNTVPTDSIPTKSYGFIQTIKYSTHY